MNDEPTPEDTVENLARELDISHRQRDFLGGQLSDRITRFHAARVAHGECTFDAAGATIRAEIDALERHLGAIAHSPSMAD